MYETWRVSGSEQGATKLGIPRGVESPPPQDGFFLQREQRGGTATGRERAERGQDSSCGSGSATPWTSEREQAQGPCIVPCRSQRADRCGEASPGHLGEGLLGSTLSRGHQHKALSSPGGGHLDRLELQRQEPEGLHLCLGIGRNLTRCHRWAPAVRHREDAADLTVDL